MKKVVLVFIRHYAPGFKLGGPVRSVVNMVDRLGELFDFRIVTSDRDVMDGEPYRDVAIDSWTAVGNARVHYTSPRSRSTGDLARLVSATPHDLLYFNSFFDFEFTLRPLLARRMGRLPSRPVLIAPRGEFSQGALAIKRWKKAPFMALAQAVGLYRDVLWHASNEHESRDIRRSLGVPADRVLLARNLPSRILRPAARLGSSPATGGPLKVVFLSRISPKKNLVHALEVLARVAKPVDFDIWGTIEDQRYWTECQEVLARVPDHIRVAYRGVAENARIGEILSQYDLFFLPTRGENYGHVVIEALSSGLPVLLSDQTPWSDLEASGIGWAVPLSDMDASVRIIEREYNLAPRSREERRETVFGYAARHASDEDAVAQNVRLFERATGAG